MVSKIIEEFNKLENVLAQVKGMALGEAAVVINQFRALKDAIEAHKSELESELKIKQENK